MPFDFVRQVPELIEIAGAAVQLPADLLKAIDIEINGGERMAHAVGFALAVAPDATVDVPAEQRKALTHHSQSVDGRRIDRRAPNFKQWRRAVRRSPLRRPQW